MAQCELFPKITTPKGESQPSELYKQLLKKLKSRPVVNLVYATYLQQGVDTAMDTTYKRNFQGQHDADDVLKFLEFENILLDMSDVSIRTMGKATGAMVNGVPVQFDNSVDALKIADNINNKKRSSGEPYHMVASVLHIGDGYQIVIKNESAYTLGVRDDIHNRLEMWDKVSKAFKLKGYDLDSLKESYPNVLHNETTFAPHLQSLAFVDNYRLSEEEIGFLLDLSKSNPNTARLISVLGGNIKDAAKACWDNYNVQRNPGYNSLINRVLNDARGIIADIIDQDFINNNYIPNHNINHVTQDFEVASTITALNTQYGINKWETTIDKKQIQYLSEANMRAIVIIQRRINDLKSKTTDKSKIDEYKHLQNKLNYELEQRRYTQAIMTFIGDACNTLKNLESGWNNLKQNGTRFENAKELAELMQEQSYFLDGNRNLFRDLLYDLSKMDSVIIDTNITYQELEDIKTEANKAMELITALKRRAESMEMYVMEELVGDLLGEKISASEIHTLVSTMKSQSWITEFLYSFGKLTNPVAASIGKMVREQQDTRNEELRKITVRIRQLDGKLKEAGYDSKFMYDDDGYIISDYNFVKFNKAKDKEFRKLLASGLRGNQLDAAINDWIDENTDLLCVDSVNDRYERVPKLSKYRNYPDNVSFRDFLSKEQLDYYDAMMQIKGEMGSLLPEWARTQFVPPQLRRQLLDAYTQKSGFHDKVSATIESFADNFKVRDDDTMLASNGYIDSDVMLDMQGNRRKRIPVFFVKRVNQKELLKNFSAGVQSLAAVAENYHYMSEIHDVAEFMRNYVMKTGKSEQSGEDPLREATTTGLVRILSNIKNNTTSTIDNKILEGMFDRHFYNDLIKENPYFTKAIGSIVKYTSFKGLSTNTAGAAANVLVGNLQMVELAIAGSLQKAIGGQTAYFTSKSYAKALKRVLFEGAKTTGAKFVPSVVLDLMSNNKQSIDYLLAEYFDLKNENFSTMGHTSYRGKIAQWIQDPSFVLYSGGETMMRYTVLYAMLDSAKVEIDGKEVSIFEMFEKSNDPLNPELKFKPNVMYNGIQITTDTGELTSGGKALMKKFKKDLRYSCHAVLGAVNDEDKGVIHNYAVGRAAMNFRQWMVDFYSERYRGTHYDSNLEKFTKGYYVKGWELFSKGLVGDEARYYYSAHKYQKAFASVLGDLKNFKYRIRKEWHNMDEHEKLGIYRMCSEISTTAAVWALSCWMSGGLFIDDDERKKYRKNNMSPMEKKVYYQLCRALMEAKAAIPSPYTINTFYTLLQTPIPALNTLDNALYIFTGIGDIDDTIQRGPDKGENKYWRNLKKNTLPFWKDWKRMTDDDYFEGMFGVFDK